MNDEQQLIAALRNEQDSDLSRLVYADWLEEQGDHVRAEYLRLNVELDEHLERLRREPDPRLSAYIEPIARTRLRLRKLAAKLAEDWLAAVHRGRVNICKFKSKEHAACPSRWESLRDGRQATIRRCDVCRARVRFCTDELEINAAKKAVFASMYSWVSLR